MNRNYVTFRELATACMAVLLLGACVATYQPQVVDVRNSPAEIMTKTTDDVTVSTTILSDSLAKQLYGVDLGEVGLQAVWLRIENQSEHALWLLVSALVGNQRLLRYGFAVTLPDGHFDFERLDAGTIYAERGRGPRASAAEPDGLGRRRSLRLRRGGSGSGTLVAEDEPDGRSLLH